MCWPITSDRDVVRVLQERLSGTLGTQEQARLLGVATSTWGGWRRGRDEADFLLLMNATMAVGLIIRVSIAGVVVDLVDRQTCAVAWRTLMEAHKSSIWNLEIQSGVGSTTSYAAARGARRPHLSQLHALAMTVGGSIELVEIDEKVRAVSFVAARERTADSASSVEALHLDESDMATQYDAIERRIADVNNRIATLRAGSTQKQRDARLRAELHALAAEGLRI